MTQLSALLSDGGLFTTEDAEQFGIPRHRLSRMVKNGELERVSHGVYTLPDTIYDRYEALQIRTKQAIYSHETALYFHGLFDRTPHILQLTVPQGFNASRLKERAGSIRVYYMQNDVLRWVLRHDPAPWAGESVFMIPRGQSVTLLEIGKR